jgi:ApeA N-terminal domain 1/Apea-like HEPN
MILNKNMEKFELRGIWWLPSNELLKVSGLLKYNYKDGGSLELFGTLYNGEPQNIIINGETSSGEKITLNKCMLSNLMRTSKYEYSDYLVPEIFFNVHFTNATQIKFSEVFCHYSNTQEWAQLAGFESEQDMLQNKLILKQNLPSKLEYKIEENVFMSYFLQVNNQFFRKEVFENININQRVFFSFRFSEEKPYDFIEEFYIYHLQHFISLATANPVYPLELSAKKSLNTNNNEKGEHNPLVRIFLYQGEREKKLRKTNYFNMLFLLKDISSSVDTYFKNWFSNKELLQPTIGLFMSRLGNSNLYIENQFLNLAQALESYHRRKINTKKYTDEEKDKLLQNILENIDKKYEKDISEKLRYIDEVSLRRRIKDIFDLAPTVLGKFYKRNEFAHQVALVRNYYTHLDIKAKSEVDKIDINKLMDKLEITIIVCLLIEIGFDIHKIDTMLKRRDDYSILTSETV